LFREEGENSLSHHASVQINTIKGNAARAELVRPRVTCSGEDIFTLSVFWLNIVSMVISDIFLYTKAATD